MPLTSPEEIKSKDSQTLAAQHKAFLEVVLVLRDFFQGLYANRIPFSHPMVIEILGLWNELVKSYQEGDQVKFCAIEAGGAHPQVTAEFANKDYMEEYRLLRAAAPDAVIRPLWRGANGFLLAPSAKEDLEHLLTHLAEDLAHKKPGETKDELLRIKVFDSQGIMPEVASTLEIIEKLRDQDYAITSEIAIPYSSGDAYPDELYLSKILEAIRLIQKSGIPLASSRISLKDMVGQLNAVDAERLIPKMIDVLVAENLVVPLGLHLHDTGLATEAYVAAIKIFKERNYPTVMDSVECAAIKPEFTGKNAWRNTGFASFLKVNELLKKAGVDLGVRQDQIEKLEEIQAKVKELADSYEVRRADSALSGDELREFSIPGGGFASYSEAVLKSGIAKKLNITESEALRVVGHGLKVVGALMGMPFAVTPGFQNKQISALHLLKNMHEAGLLKPEMGYETIIAMLDNIYEGLIKTENRNREEIKLTEEKSEEQKSVSLVSVKKIDLEQIAVLFLKELPDVIRKFLEGEMPVESVSKLPLRDTLNIELEDKDSESKDKEAQKDLAQAAGHKYQVHSLIRQQIKPRKGLLTDGVQPKLALAKQVAEGLLEIGKIKPTEVQAKKIIGSLKLENDKFSDLNLSELMKCLLQSRPKELGGKSLLYVAPDGSNTPWVKIAKNILKGYFLTLDKKSGIYDTGKKDQLNFAAAEKAEIIVKKLMEATIQTYITWALELGDPKKLEAAITEYWRREPDPQDYSKFGKYAVIGSDGKPRCNQELYIEHLRTRTGAGRNPKLDAVEEIWLRFIKNNPKFFEDAGKIKNGLLHTEALAIKEMVLNLVIENSELVTVLAQNDQKLTKPIVQKLLNAEREALKSHAKAGKDFRIPTDIRLDIACVYLAEILQDVAKINIGNEAEIANDNAKIDFLKLIKEERALLESKVVTAKFSGNIVAVLAKFTDGVAEVKAGDELYKINAMKAETKVLAPRSGKLRANIKPGDLVQKYQTLFEYVPDAPELTTDSEVKLDVSVDPERLKDIMKASKHKFEATINETKKAEEVMARMVESVKVIGEYIEKDSLGIEGVATEHKESKIILPLDTEAVRTGYLVPKLNLTDFAKSLTHKKEIHVIGNRSVSAVKLYGDLKQAGYNNLKVFCTQGDRSTPLINGIPDGQIVSVQSYNNHSEVLANLIKIAKENPAETIYYHPGWGFLAEDAAFGEKLEKSGIKNLKFVGPASKPMEIAGGKKTLRDLVAKVNPEFNPEYFGNDASLWFDGRTRNYNAADLRKYIDNGFQIGAGNAQIHQLYCSYFKEVQKMGGDVVLKAVAGGGGKGIKFFKIDPSKSDEENYREYVRLACENMEYAEKNFGNGEMLTEQCISGATRHLELQLVLTATGSLVLGQRDCTLQHKDQKMMETNIIKGDYSPELIEKINKAGKGLADKMRETGYTGVATLEMLITKDGELKILEGNAKVQKPDKSKFLEVNTRVQVEHEVTERDIAEKTGKNISIPLLNLLCVQYPHSTPEELLFKYFGLTKNDILNAQAPGETRILHPRIDLKTPDLVEGEMVPTEISDFAAYDPAILAGICGAHNVSYLNGGAGRGDFGQQIGSLCGTRKDVEAVLGELVAYENTMAVFTRSGMASTSFLKQISAAMFNEQGNFRSGFGTKTLEEFLTAVKNKEISVDVDYGGVAVTREPKEGALSKAMACHIEQSAMQREEDDFVLASTFAQRHERSNGRIGMAY